MFESNVEISVVLGESVINFTVYYEISDTGINMTVSNLTSIYEEFVYDFGPLHESRFCVGSNEAPDSKCSIEFPDGDFQYDMVFSFSFNPDPWQAIQGGIVGELARRNGTFVRNGNQIYTPKSPCWTKTGSFLVSNYIGDSSFCCTLFDDGSHPVSTTTPASDSTESTKAVSTDFEILKMTSKGGIRD